MISVPDYRSIARRLIRSVRGRRQSSVLSRRLGFSYDKVGRCESGSLRFSWVEFVRLCECCGCLKALERSMGFLTLSGRVEDLGDTARLMAQLLAGPSPVQMAEQLGMTEVTVRRWVQGKRIPDLEHVLQLLDLGFRSLPEFLRELLPAEKLRQFFPEVEQHLRTCALFGAEPMAVCALVTLSLPEFAHGFREGVVAQKLALSLERERELVRALEDTGLVVREGSRLVPKVPDLIVYGDENFEATVRFARFWMGEGLKHLNSLREPPPFEFFKTFTIPMSPSLQKEFFVLLGDFKRRVHDLIAAERPDADSCYTFVMHLYDMAGERHE